jgi:dihydroorotate dehydrogenase
MLYSVARPFLFSIDPETAHETAFGLLESARASGVLRLAACTTPALPVRAMGLDFPNPVGLAAGLDKNGDHIDALLQLGFGFIEVGAVTPRPQPGNARPRLFRLERANALINRMGFNNLGVDHLVANFEKRRPRGIVGVNIGRNFDTPNEHANDDYVECLRKVYPYASFVTANVSSPNTANLRSLQHSDALDSLLRALSDERARLAAVHGRRVPLALKIAPDLSDDDIDAVAHKVLERGFDAVIATNTTTGRTGVEHIDSSRETGGLSGAPLRARSTAVVARLARSLAGKLPIIGVGGIASWKDAQEKLDAGATLVQLYTALVYQGPGLAREIVRGLARKR